MKQGELPRDLKVNAWKCLGELRRGAAHVTRLFKTFCFPNWTARLWTHKDFLRCVAGLGDRETLPQPAESSSIEMDSAIPPLGDLKGPGVFATYRIAYLENKPLLL